MEVKPKVYLCGSIAAGRDFVDGINLISDTIEKLGYRVMTKSTTVNTAKKYTNSSTLSSRRGIVKRDKRWIRESDFVIQEVSQYSHGVGYEHAYAESQDKPVLLLRHKTLEGQKYSAFLDGTDYKKFMFSFYNEKNIKLVLEKFFKKYSGPNFVGKDNEEVLVVKTDKLFPNGIWEGFKKLDEQEFINFINKNSEYLKRGFAETDESYQQIVAQIILKVGNKIFIHKVSQHGSENRLHDMWPIFLGGHINNTDRDISKAFDREFKEEINYKGKIISKKFLGVVKLHDNPVNRVHVGLVWLYEGDTEDFENTEDNHLSDRHFADIKHLQKIQSKMSYWSKVVFPKIKSLLN